MNPMDDDQSWRKLHGQAKDRTTQKYYLPHQNTVYWCKLKLAQKKGLQFYQTRSHAIVLYNTLPAICIEKAVCMKTKEELFHKVCQSPRLPRVILKPNSQSGQQDQLDQEGRKSTTRAHRELTGKPAAVTSTVEYRAYFNLRSNNKTRIAEKRSKS